MPTVRSFKYKVAGVLAVIIAILYGAYHLYSNSAGVLISRAASALEVGNPNGARELLNRILNGNPDHLDALLLLSRITLDRGEFPVTSSQLSRILELDPENREALTMQTSIHLFQCRFLKAQLELEDLEKRSALSPMQDGMLALAIAGQIVGDANWEDKTGAIQTHAERASEAARDLGEAHIAKALLSLATNQPEEALAGAKLGQQKLGSLFLTEWVVGKAQFLMGDVKAAMATWDRADALRKNRRDLEAPAAWNMELYLYRGLAQIALGDLDQAEKMLETALENDPSALVPARALVDLYLIRGGEEEVVSGGNDEVLRSFRRASDELSQRPSLLEANSTLKYQLALIQIYLRNHSKAIEILEDLASDQPPHLQSLFELGNLYSIQASFTRAARLFKKVLQNQTEDVTANYNLGTLSIRNNNITDAQEKFEDVIRKKPDWLPAKLNLGLCYRLAGLFVQAQDLYQRILEASPNDVDALIGLGLIASAQGNLDTAQDSFSKAQDAHPKRSEPYYYLGQVELSRGRDAAAESYLEKCLNLDSDDEFAAMSLVEIHLMRGSWDLARERLEKILDNPNSRLRPIVENALILTDLASGQLQRAKRNMSEFEKSLPEMEPNLQASYWMNQATLAQQEQRMDDLFDIARKVVELAPRDADAFYNRGTFLLEAKKYQDAALAFRRALELDPEHEDARYNMAVAQATLGRWEKALEFLAVLGTGEGAALDVVRDLAEAFIGAGRPGEALKVLEPALERSPSDASLSVLKINALIESGDVEVAEEVSREVVKEFPQSAPVQMACGMAAFLVGDEEAGETHLRRAAAIQPDDPLIKLNLATFLIAQGEFEGFAEAEKLLAEVGQAGIHPHAVSNQKGLMAFRREEFKAAKEHFQASLKTDEGQTEIADLFRQIDKL